MGKSIQVFVFLSLATVNLGLFKIMNLLNITAANKLFVILTRQFLKRKLSQKNWCKLLKVA